MMARIKERDWVKVGFNLDPEINKRIGELADFENISKSHFIELIVSRWDEGINPQIKLNALFKKRDFADAKLSEIDSSIKQLTTQISSWDIIKREKAKKKPDAIEILKRLLKEGNIDGAEKAARFWQTQTGFSSFELLVEAKSSLEIVETKHL